MSKKLAIVGSGPNTRSLAPFDNPDFDIWVFNEAGNHEWCKRWTACFQMHSPNIYKGHNTKDPQHWEWLQRTHGKPVYMQEVDPLVPDSVRYPLEDARRLCGVNMFPTSFAYMAALAVLQGYDEVRVFGVELSSSEYSYQANGYMFWFGFLVGKLGVDKVDTAVRYMENNIFDVPYYGYDGGFAFTVEYFEKRASELENENRSAERNLNNIKIALLKSIDDNEFEKVERLSREYQGASQLHGEIAGALQEAKRYSAFGDRQVDRGGFEYQAASSQNQVTQSQPLIWSFGGKCEYMWNAWKQTKGAQGREQLKVLLSQLGEQSFKTGGEIGMMNENIRYIEKYDRTMIANGVMKHA